MNDVHDTCMHTLTSNIISESGLFFVDVKKNLAHLHVRLSTPCIYTSTEISLFSYWPIESKYHSLCHFGISAVK